MKKYLLSMIFVLMCGLSGMCQDFAQFKQLLDWQVYNYPQEKIHVTTDKPYYITGDTIWLRAFVVDASSHMPVDASKYVYVELLSPLREVVQRVKIKERKGVFSGYLPLDPTEIAEGEYTLTAYTLFMQNQGEQYFFKKPVSIISSFSVNSRIEHEFEWKNKGKDNEQLQVNLRYIDTQTGERRQYTKFECLFSGGRKIEWLAGDRDLSVDVKKDEMADGCLLVKYGNHGKYISFPSSGTTTYDVSFYPEGGYLVPAVENRMTFKAMDSNGKSIEVTGSLVDTSGETIATASTSHDGMGLLSFTPRSGVAYKFICQSEDLGEKTFDIPAVRDDATIVQATHDGNLLTLTAHGAQQGSAMLAVQQRGRLLAVGHGSLTIATDTLPAGVVQALLMNETGRMLSERLLFVGGKHAPAARLKSDKSGYDSRELVQVSVDLSEFADSTSGNIAVSVTDDRTIQADSTLSILSNLLLQSDLQGRVNNPQWYFLSPSRNKELDLLMMTQGWRRYDVPHAMLGRTVTPKYPLEIGQVLSGRVVGEWSKKPLKWVDVKVIAPTIGYADVATTNNDGYWMLDKVDFPDGTKFICQAVNKKNKAQSNLTIYKSDSRPAVGVLKTGNVIMQPVMDNEVSVTYLSNQKQRLMYVDGVANVMLGELVITRKKKDKPEDMFEMQASNSLDYKYFEKNGVTSYDAALRRIAGLRITSKGLYYRNHQVAIYVDGSPLTGWGGNASSSMGTDSYSYLKMMLPFEFVRKINFGSMAGALSIMSKNGTEERKNRRDNTIKTVTPLGFQRAAEFYAPRYDTGDGGVPVGTDLRETLYWNPNVTIGTNKQARFNFYANDAAATSYTITVEGITATGELIHAVKQVEKK